MGYVLSLEAITRVIKELGKREKIIFTHGVFDLFHIGQSEFLRKSKELGQVLIVGIDSDKLVSICKGVKRPVIPLDQRMGIISKQQFVDFVFPLEYLPRLDCHVSKYKPSKYHLNLYKELKPNIVAYGRKYGGMETVKKGKNYIIGTKFKKITHKYDRLQSSTKIIDKILSSKTN